MESVPRLPGLGKILYSYLRVSFSTQENKWVQAKSSNLSLTRRRSFGSSRIKRLRDEPKERLRRRLVNLTNMMGDHLH